jgi:hypothetical protein
MISGLSIRIANSCRARNGALLIEQTKELFLRKDLYAERFCVRELGARADPPATKAAMARRLARLVALADET